MAQKFERVVEEDLNVGTEPAWVCCPGSGELRATQVGIHSVARGQQAYTSTWAVGAVAAGLNASTTIAVKDAYLKDFVMASHDKILTSALRISGHVTSADTVMVIIHNPTSASITVASGTLKVVVFPQCSAQASAAADPTSVAINEDVTFTPTVTLGTPLYTYLWDFGAALPTINLTDLYGYWSMDETSGNSRVCSLGSGPDLLETGGAVADAVGRFTNAASSTEADTSGLEATLAPSLALSAGLTVAFWFKLAAWTDGKPETLLGLTGAGSTTPYITVVRYYDSEWLEIIFAWAPGQYVVLPNPRLGNFTVGEWHLLVLTYDPSTGEFIGRVDDGCMASATDWVTLPLPAERLSAIVPAGSLAAANASTFAVLRMLKAFDGNHINLAGQLDDLRIWTRVLTAAEIADIWYRSDEEISAYSYGEAGVQTATLTITDATGCTASDTVDVTVIDYSVTVTAAQIEGGTDGDAIVEFDYVVTGGTAPYTYSLAWTGGGGGGPRTDVDPTVTFTGGVPLEYDTIPYTLTVTDDALVVATYSSSVDIQYWDAP